MQTVIKTLPVEAGRAKLSESAAADKEASGSKPGSSASAAADVSKVSASPFASLGGLGGGVTMLGGSGGSGPLGSISLSTVGPSSSSARERALAAARRVPSPEPQPKKEKAKKVSWRKEDALVGVRWFLKVSSEQLQLGCWFTASALRSCIAGCVSGVGLPGCGCMQRAACWPCHATACFGGRMAVPVLSPWFLPLAIDD